MVLLISWIFFIFVFILISFFFKVLFLYIVICCIFLLVFFVDFFEVLVLVNIGEYIVGLFVGVLYFLGIEFLGVL